MKILIVGSMKFHSRFNELMSKLESQGNKVIIPFNDEFYSKEVNIKRKAMKDFNDNLKASDAILVANFDKDGKPNYIGVNALMEIGMAFILDKKIYLLNDMPEGFKEEFNAMNVISLKGNLDNLK